MKEGTLKYRDEKAVKQLVIGFAYSLLDMEGDISRYSPEEFHSFLDAGWELWLRDPNSDHFIEKLQLFFGELEEQRKPPFEIGSYIAKHLEN